MPACNLAHAQKPCAPAPMAVILLPDSHDRKQCDNLEIQPHHQHGCGRTVHRQVAGWDAVQLFSSLKCSNVLQDTEGANG